MSIVKCPSCGNAVEAPEKKSGLPWVVGCLVAVLAIPVVIAVIGLLAAIAIPSFVKARNTSQMNACINNMRRIDSAKDQWAISDSKSAGDNPDIDVANEYIKGGTPVCPAGGQYEYNSIGADPECSVHGLLSAPQAFRSQSRTGE
jgi:hypothetical protein